MEAIREDKPYNEVKRGAKASLVTSMGRMAAHTGPDRHLRPDPQLPARVRARRGQADHGRPGAAADGSGREVPGAGAGHQEGSRRRRRPVPNGSPANCRRRITLALQFCSWSACRMNRTSSARASTGLAVLRLHHLPQHVHEVFRVAQVVVRVHVGEPEAVAVAVRRDGWHFADQPVICRFRFSASSTSCASGYTVDSAATVLTNIPIGCASYRNPPELLGGLVNSIVWWVTSLPPTLQLTSVGSFPFSSRYATSRKCTSPPVVRSDIRDTAECPCRRR
jgi:hypothetical protein